MPGFVFPIVQNSEVFTYKDVKVVKSIMFIVANSFSVDQLTDKPTSGMTWLYFISFVSCTIFLFSH